MLNNTKYCLVFSEHLNNQIVKDLGAENGVVELIIPKLGKINCTSGTYYLINK